MSKIIKVEMTFIDEDGSTYTDSLNDIDAQKWLALVDSYVLFRINRNGLITSGFEVFNWSKQNHE